MKNMKKVLALFLVITIVMSCVVIDPATMQVKVQASDLQESVGYGEFNGNTYQIFDISLTWNEAKAYCEDFGGHLVTITSAEEQAFIATLVNKGEKNQYWIGLTTTEEPQWITGEEYSYSNWDAFEPNNSTREDGESEDYVHINNMPNPYNWGSQKYKWNDMYYDNIFPDQEDHFSTEKVGFICEWETSDDDNLNTEFNGNTYELFDISLTWQDAKKYCEDIGGHLVTITSAEEQAYVETLLSNGEKSQYWIGLTTAEEPQWITGEEYSYSNWDAFEPNNSTREDGESEDYVHINIMPNPYNWGSQKYKWNDMYYDNIFPDQEDHFSTEKVGFICEWDTSAYSLSEESAIAFIGFLTSNGKLTEKEVKNSVWFKLITNTYTGEDKKFQARALVAYAISATDQMAGQAVDNSSFLNKELVAFLEEELNRQTGLSEEVINELQAKASENLTEAIYDVINTLLPTSADNPFNVTDIYDYYCTLTGSVEKGRVLAERIVAGIEATLMVLEAEKAGRYTYFSLYLSDRGNYSSKNDEIFRGLLSTNQLIISQNNLWAGMIDLVKPITGKDSFMNHFDLIEEWAEYIYQLSCYCNTANSETTYTRAEESDFSYEISETNAIITAYQSGTGGKIVLPDKIEGNSVVKIENGAFTDCTTLEGVKLGNEVETIGEDAFNGCTALEDVTITSNVTTIEKSAFANCTSLLRVILPNSVNSIADNTFDDCSEDLTVLCNCDNAYAIEYCEKNNIKYIIIHEFNNYDSDNNATCSEYGTITSKCDSCDTTNTITDFASLTDHLWDEGTLTKAPTATDEGECTFVCEVCGISKVETVLPLTFSGASLTLQDNLAINYKVSKSLFEEAGYTNPYVKFVLNGVETVVTEYTVVGDNYVFDFTDIAPHMINDTIYATLYATYNGVEYASAVREYSVATYCYNMLGKYTTEEYAELQTLLVDLLNYGSKTQEYLDYQTDNLANAQLTAEQAAWGTSTERAFATLQDTKYEAIENPSVLWKGAGLTLQDSITMRFKIAAENIEGLSVKVTCAGGEWTVPAADFELIEAGSYYVYFDALSAAQMSEPVYLTVYNGDTAVSHTIRYSVESYAYAKQNDADTNLVALVRAMMKYGDSAYAYVN